MQKHSTVGLKNLPSVEKRISKFKNYAWANIELGYKATLCAYSYLAHLFTKMLFFNKSLTVVYIEFYEQYVQTK